jgi:hypothetical protein
LQNNEFNQLKKLSFSKFCLFLKKLILDQFIVNKSDQYNKFSFWFINIFFEKIWIKNEVPKSLKANLFNNFSHLVFDLIQWLLKEFCIIWINFEMNGNKKIGIGFIWFKKRWELDFLIKSKEESIW